MTQESKWSSGSRKGMGMDDLLRWKKCNIVVANFHVFKNLHPLTFGVSAEHAGALNAEEDSFIGCLKWQPTLNANVIAAQNQLIMVETLSEQDIATLCHVTGTCKGGNILLYASEISIRHYGLNSVTSAGFRIRHSNTVTLSKVLLCSKTDESYEWVQSENWCTDLFLNSCQKPILCRQGDVCMFPLRSSVNDLATYERESEHRFNLVVVDSQPVRQGIIGHSTEITIVKSDFLLKPPMEKKQQEGERERFEAAAGPATTLNSVSCFNGLLKWLFILLLQYGIASRKMKPIQMAIGWFAFGFKIASSWRARLNIQILPKPPFRLHCKELFDPHQVIFVTSKFLLQYELSDLSWIVVMLQCQESRYQKRAVRLCAVEKHLDFIDISVFGCLQDSVAYITPQLWFNLNPQPSRLIQPDTILLLQVGCGVGREF